MCLRTLPKCFLSPGRLRVEPGADPEQGSARISHGCGELHVVSNGGDCRTKSIWTTFTVPSWGKNKSPGKEEIQLKNLKKPSEKMHGVQGREVEG